MLSLLLALQTVPALPAAKPDVEHTPRDWAATLRIDAQALHDDIAANHPGPVNRADPGFARHNDAQLALALTRARTARTYADYWFALRHYAASFDDGHLSLASPGATPGDGSEWPGFLTTYDDRARQIVVDRAPDAPVPLGAELIACDGRSADRLAAETVGVQVGRWSLESQRQAYGGWLFAGQGDPYIHRPARCTFGVNGRRQVVTLAWRHIDHGAQITKLNAIRRHVSYSFAARTLPDGTRWYAVPSFGANPRSPAGQALPGMIAAMRADRDALAAAPAIVLDLRGNDGGSSDWSVQIADVLWGPAAVRQRPQVEEEVDWRASRANLASLEASFAEQGGKGSSPEADHWFRTTIAGLRGAIARGEPLWRASDEDDNESVDKTATPPAPPPPLRGPVFLVTDGSCGSACLDAVDLWRAMGAAHVGRTTSADTLYMDVRRYTLPSGLAKGSIPMKVYRGRPRGANVPVVPVHAFAGDNTDTPALETWIASLRSATR